MTTRTLTITLTGKHKQHACRIIEEIINPALRDYECTVQWPDMTEPEINVIYDPDNLRAMFDPNHGANA